MWSWLRCSCTGCGCRSSPRRGARTRPGPARPGDGQLAAAIGALRKPTVAAWSARLLARRRPQEAHSLIQLSEALRAAHRSLDAGQLRKLSHDQHVVIGEPARAARTLAAEAGRPATKARPEAEAAARKVERLTGSEGVKANPLRAAKIASLEGRGGSASSCGKSTPPPEWESVPQAVLASAESLAPGWRPSSARTSPTRPSAYAAGGPPSSFRAWCWCCRGV